MKRRTLLKWLPSLGAGLTLFPKRSWGAPNEGPRRLIIFHWPQGTQLSGFTPTGSEFNFEMPSLLTPLADHRDQMIVLSGIDNVMPNLNDVSTAHPNANYTFLTGQPFLLQDPAALTPAGPSIDAVIAKRLAGATPYPRLDFAVGGPQNEDGVYTPIEQAYFWHGPFDPVSSFNNPTKAFLRLFGGLNEDPDLLYARRGKRAAVLSRTLRFFDRMQTDMSAEDKALIDAHADKVSQLYDRISVDTGTCSQPQQLFPHDYSPSYDDNLTAPAMIDLMVGAMSCGLTNVSTLQFANSHDHGFEWLWTENSGMPIVNRNQFDNWHAVVHADPQPGMATVYRWYMRQLAYLLNRLTDTTDNDGRPLIESTLVLACSEFSSGRHWHTSLPIALAGRTGVPMGRWINHLNGTIDDLESSGGSLASGYTMNQLLLSVLHMFGFDDDHFGHTGDEVPNGPLESLLG